MASSVPFQALNLAPVALYSKQERPSDNGEVVSTVTAHDTPPLHMHHKHFSLITGDYQTLCNHCSDLPWVARLHQKAVFYWAISVGCSPCLHNANVWGGDKPPERNGGAWGVHSCKS